MISNRSLALLGLVFQLNPLGHLYCRNKHATVVNSFTAITDTTASVSIAWPPQQQTLTGELSKTEVQNGQGEGQIGPKMMGLVAATGPIHSPITGPIHLQQSIWIECGLRFEHRWYQYSISALSSPMAAVWVCLREIEQMFTPPKEASNMPKLPHGGEQTPYLLQHCTGLEYLFPKYLPQKGSDWDSDMRGGGGLPHSQVFSPKLIPEDWVGLWLSFSLGCKLPLASMIIFLSRINSSHGAGDGIQTKTVVEDKSYSKSLLFHVMVPILIQSIHVYYLGDNNKNKPQGFM